MVSLGLKLTRKITAKNQYRRYNIRKDALFFGNSPANQNFLVNKPQQNRIDEVTIFLYSVTHSQHLIHASDVGGEISKRSIFSTVERSMAVFQIYLITPAGRVQKSTAVIKTVVECANRKIDETNVILRLSFNYTTFIYISRGKWETAPKELS